MVKWVGLAVFAIGIVWGAGSMVAETEGRLKKLEDDRGLLGENQKAIIEQQQQNKKFRELSDHCHKMAEVTEITVSQCMKLGQK